MLQQTNQPVEFSAFFTKNKVGKTGLSVTCDVYGPPYQGVIQHLESDVAAVALGGGVYGHQYLNASTYIGGAFHCVFKSSDPTVDAPEIRDVCIVGYQWVQNMDAGSQSILNQIQQLPASVGGGVWNTSPNPPGYQNVGTYGNLLYVLANAPAGSDPLAAVLSASYAPNTAGAALFRQLAYPALVAASTPIPLPVLLETKTIRRGDSYEAPEGRDLRWTIPGLPVTWNYTGARAWVSVGLDGSGLLFPRTEAQIITADPITGTLVVSLALTSTITDTLEPGTYLFDIEIDFADTHPVTVGAGQFVVTADVR